MIQKIGQRVGFSNNIALKTQENKNIVDKNLSTQNPIESTSIDSKLLQKYYVSFGSKENAGKSEKQMLLEKKLKFLEQHYTQDAENLIESATSIAKKYGHAEVNENHIEKAALESISNYIEDLDAGVKTLNLNTSYQLPGFFTDFANPSIFKDKKERDKLKPVIKEEIENLDKILSNIPKEKAKSEPILSKRIINGVSDIVSEVSLMEQTKEVPVDDSTFLSSILTSNQSEVDNNLKKFLFKFSDAVMSDSRSTKEKIHLSIYDDKAKNILKNLSLGTNMFIIHDKGADPMYLVDSVVDVLEKQKAEFGQINKDNTKITIFNKNIKQDFFVQKIKELAKDKNISHIVVANEDNLLVNSMKMVETADGMAHSEVSLSDELFDLMKNQPKNVKVVLVQSKNSYYSTISDPVFKKAFENFGEISFPVLSTEQAKKAFKEQPLLMSKIEATFSKKAIDKVIESAALLEGTYPEKAQDIMKKLASYYVKKPEINETDVKKYMEEARDLFKITGDGSSVEVVFDTGKKLDDFLGKSATKKEAAAIVKQIKKGSLGTKGKIIYSQDGVVGSGRKFFAKSIAGETKSPYVEINAMDFGTEGVDIFGGGVLSPENSIKKVFSLVKTQAEASPHKSAIVFVENFEYLPFGETVSEYYSKAMSQLLREMENASKKGLNILVLGSVNDSSLANACSEKALKFIDRIEVESPSRNIEARAEILADAIKKKNLKMVGSTEADKKEIVKLMAETSDGFPFVYLRNFVDKTKAVAFERGHKQAEKSDVTEAYLQLTTGRPSSGPISKHRKEIVTSHECGHALTDEVMWGVAEKQNIPWHLPDKVNFITLDPRSDFGGMMSTKDGGNEENSFEKRFADLVCDFGGHSAEKKFYNIDGSWGITEDMRMATQSASVAVGYMGQGHNTGKISIGGMLQPPSGKVAENMEKDVNVMLKNSLLVSDLITETYAGFNKEFTDKYAKLVGTGDCLVQGDTFRQELKDWISKQAKVKRAEIEYLDKTILDIIEATKRGKEYNIKLLSQRIKKFCHLALRFK